MVNEEAALLDRRVTQVTPAALFSRRLQMSMTLDGAGLSIVYSSDYVSDLIDEFDRNVEDVKGNRLSLRP